MARGDVHRETFHRFPDPVTGREIVRVTDPGHACHHPYFYYRMFTPDGRRLLYVSSRQVVFTTDRYTSPTGNTSIYLAGIQLGDFDGVAVEQGAVARFHVADDEDVVPIADGGVDP